MLTKRQLEDTIMQNRLLHARPLFLILCGLVLIAGCDDDPSSPQLVESWVLESYLGQEPPFPLFETDDQAGVSCLHVLVSSEIELRTERHAERRDELSERCGDQEAEPYTDVRDGTWSMTGDSLFLDLETDDPILPHAPFRGEIVGDRLTFEFQTFSEATGIDTVAIVYRRMQLEF